MKRVATLASVAGFALASCSVSGAGPLTRDQAVELARDYSTREIPGTALMTAPVVQDRGATWVVRFDPPEGYAGGSTWVEMDKQTRRVVRTRAEQ